MLNPQKQDSAVFGVSFDLSFESIEGEMEKNIWEKAKINIRQKNPSNHKLLAWIDQVEFIKLQQSSLLSGQQKLHLSVPSELCRDWITDNLKMIHQEISDIHGHPLEVEIHVCFQKKEGSSHLEQTSKAAEQEKTSLTPTTVSSSDSEKNLLRVSSHKEYLNPTYTFNTFVVGQNSEFAHGACYRVAQSPGKGYNPLFIYGPTGVGKTHLLHATGKYIQENFPDLRVKYLSAEKFFTECIAGIRHKKMDLFKKRYREKYHVLLMDDIQTFGRGESVQEEFFHTLNSFFEKGRQVVVASDCMPKDIQGLTERIRTRLEWGLIADIQMPDIETRIAILKQKTEIMNLHVPDDVLEFLAKISKKSVRELEGNLNKVKMYTELKALPISLEIAQNFLANHNSKTLPLTTEDIQKIVAHHYKIKVPELKSKNRSKPIVTARQMAMFLIRKYLKDKSLVDIGRAFNGRDHTTVMHSIKKIETHKNYEIQKDIKNLSEHIESKA